MVPLTLLLVLGEVGVRLHRGALLDTGDARRTRRELLASSDPASYDPELGWVPTPGFRGPFIGASVSVDGETCRRHDGDHHPAGLPLLAVGDSFVFGAQVGDDEAWPAVLERGLGHHVINGGVFGYGLDQVLLRTERLLRGRRVSGIVVGFIGDDIARCELSRRDGAWKPYYEVTGGDLRLDGVPVPPVTEDAGLLARSHLLDAIFQRFAPVWWGSGRERIRVQKDGLAVACLVVDHLDCLARRLGVPWLLVGEGQSQLNGDLRPLLEHARARGVACLDLTLEQDAVFRADPGVEARWYHGHMTTAGNAWVGGRIREELQRRWPERFARPPAPE
jgi:hypothetical protein